MKTTFGIVAGIVLTILSACSKSEINDVMTLTKAKSIVENFESRFEKTRSQPDVIQLNEMIADEFMLINPEGKIVDKRKCIDNDLALGQPVFESFTYQLDSLHVTSNSILAIGSFSNKGMLNNRDISGSYRFTKLYLNRDKRWQLALTHLTKIID